MIGLKIAALRPPDPVPGVGDIAWLVGSALAVAALHLAQVPVWLGIGAAVPILWRLLIAHRGGATPSLLVRMALALAATIAVYQHYHTVFGRDAGTAFLLVLVSLKILESRTVRDYLIVIFLLYFLTLARFFFSQSLVTGVWAFGVTFVTTLSLIRLTQGNAVSVRESVSLTGRMLLQAVPLMLIVYLVFPRIQGSLWALPEDAFAAGTGLSEELTPGSVNALLLDETVAFRVEFDGPPPAHSQLYWRTLVMSESDGRAWRLSPADRFGTVAEPLIDGSGPVRYTVTHESSNRPWLPALDMPDAAPVDTRLKAGRVLQARRPLHRKLRYEVLSYRDYRTGPLAPRTHAALARWPGQPTARVRQLVAQWQAQADSPEQFVAAVLDYFRTEAFFYSLRPPALGADPLDQFLFATRRGYCEHYASALAALLRIAGIPSRVVTGYLGGEWNAAGDYLLVRRSDAHAWVEVWSAERGWSRVDPTAAVAPERIELGVDALRRMAEDGIPFGTLGAEQIRALISRSWIARQWQRTRLRWDTVDALWDRWVMAYGPQAQRLFMRSLGFAAPTWVQMALTLVTGVALGLLIVALIMFRRRERRDPVAASYARFCGKLARIGYRRAPAEGPLDFARRVTRARPDLQPAVDRVTELYVALRYTPLAVRPATELRRLIARFRPRRRPALPVAAG